MPTGVLGPEEAAGILPGNMLDVEMSWGEGFCCWRTQSSTLHAGFDLQFLDLVCGLLTNSLHALYAPL